MQQLFVRGLPRECQRKRSDLTLQSSKKGDVTHPTKENNNTNKADMVVMSPRTPTNRQGEQGRADMVLIFPNKVLVTF